MAWVYLVIAGVLEVFWSTCMKFSHGFTVMKFSVLTIIGMIASFLLLSQAMKSIPLGTAYAIWTGIGAFGAVIAEALMAGMPALVSDKVGAKCLITANNGMICHSDNVEDIAVKMKKILDLVEPVDCVEKTNDSIIPYDFDALMDELIKNLQA